jgi:hypothetical protein
MTGLFYWLSDIGGWTGIGILGAITLAISILVKMKVKHNISSSVTH